MISALRARGVGVRALSDVGLLGASDSDVLAAAHVLGAAVLTHDHDFGRLAIAAGVEFIGVVFLRPGRIRPEFALEMIDTAQLAIGDVSPPFLVTVERQSDRVRIRVR